MVPNGRAPAPPRTLTTSEPEACGTCDENQTMTRDYRTLFDMTDRQALVVGAGSGIGEAVARGLAAFGAVVTCADLDTAAAERVTRGIGG